MVSAGKTLQSHFQPETRGCSGNRFEQIVAALMCEHIKFSIMALVGLQFSTRKVLHPLILWAII